MLLDAIKQKSPDLRGFHGDSWTSLNFFKSALGGEGGIRTLGRFDPTPDFESGTFDHSATSPNRRAIIAFGYSFKFLELLIKVVSIPLSRPSMVAMPSEWQYCRQLADNFLAKPRQFYQQLSRIHLRYALTLAYLAQIYIWPAYVLPENHPYWSKS